MRPPPPLLLLLSAASVPSTSAFSLPPPLRFGPTTPPPPLRRLSPSPRRATLEGRTIADGGGKVVPVNNFILVKLADAVEELDSGILLSKSAKIVKTEGTVVSVVPGKTHSESGIVIDMPVKEGDGVVYGKYDGTVVEYDGSRHALIRDDDILVKFSGDKLTVDSVDVCNDSVLVLAEGRDDTTAGGLLLAAPSKGDPQSRPSTGTVIRVGPGRVVADGSRVVADVKVGDRVKFRDFAGNEVDIEGKEYSVVKMAEILAKF